MEIPLWKRGMKGDLIDKISPHPSLLKRGIGKKILQERKWKSLFQVLYKMSEEVHTTGIR